MYLGAILVFGQRGNPDAIALAAHGLRELMEKLARHLNVPMAQTSGVTAKVFEMSAKYRAIQEAHPDRKEDLRIDFHECAEALAVWFPENHTPRSRWGAEVFDRLDPRGLKLP